MDVLPKHKGPKIPSQVQSKAPELQNWKIRDISRNFMSTGSRTSYIAPKMVEWSKIRTVIFFVDSVSTHHPQIKNFFGKLVLLILFHSYLYARHWKRVWLDGWNQRRSPTRIFHCTCPSLYIFIFWLFVEGLYWDNGKLYLYVVVAENCTGVFYILFFVSIFIFILLDF